MKMLKTYDQVVEAFGGTGMLGRYLDQNSAAVCHWKRRRETFPTKYYLVMIGVLTALGYDASPDLWGFYRRKGKPFPTIKRSAPAKPKPMTARQYRAALDELGLTVASKRTAAMLGIGLRHCQRLAAGEARVPRAIEKILRIHLKYPETRPADPRAN